MVSQKGREQIEEERVLFTLPSPSSEPSRFFTPDSPFALTCHDSRYAHATDDSVASQLCRSLYVLVQHKCIGLQSQRGSAS